MTMPMPSTTAATAMIMDEGSLYRLMAWLSPAYPVGAFGHSGGLEQAVEDGWVRRRTDLVAWIEDGLEAGTAWNDAVLFVHAWRAAARGDAEALLAVSELAAALAPCRERRVETLSQGAAFARISRAAWSEGAFDGLDPDRLAYPVAVGALGAAHAVPLRPALLAVLQALVANQVSAAQRLVPLGQTDAQTALADLMPAVLRAVARAADLPDGDPFDAVGGFAMMADLMQMRHETQYTRLFRT
jgi:urease accessory protein